MVLIRRSQSVVLAFVPIVGQQKGRLDGAALISAGIPEAGYPLGPGTVISSWLESVLASLVQMAPCALQSVVAGSDTVTSAFSDGCTVISQPALLGGFKRRALFTEPPDTVKACWGIVV